MFKAPPFDIVCVCVFQVEGIDKIYARYQTIVASVMSRSYDVLDPRRLEVRVTEMIERCQNAKRSHRK